MKFFFFSFFLWFLSHALWAGQFYGKKMIYSQDNEQVIRYPFLIQFSESSLYKIARPMDIPSGSFLYVLLSLSAEYFTFFSLLRYDKF